MGMERPNPKDKTEQPNAAIDPFQRFEDLVRNLLGVPKQEVDKAEKNEKRRKKREEVKTK